MYVFKYSRPPWVHRSMLLQQVVGDSGPRPVSGGIQYISHPLKKTVQREAREPPAVCGSVPPLQKDGPRRGFQPDIGTTIE